MNSIFKNLWFFIKKIAAQGLRTPIWLRDSVMIQIRRERQIQQEGERQIQQEGERQIQQEWELEAMSVDIKLFKEMESPETPELEMRRFIRDMRFQKETQRIMTRHRNWFTPIRTNDKVGEFLTNIFRISI